MRVLALLSAAAILLSMTVASTGAPKALAVDENEFLKTPFDFSLPEEKALDEKWLVPPKKAYPFADARIVKANGMTSIVVNGERVPTWSRSIGTAYTPSSPVERQFRQLGMRLFIIDVGLTVNRYDERLLDNAPDEVYEQFRQSADNLLAEVPDAIIIIRPWLISVSRDFAEKYPEGLLAGPDGTTDWGGQAVGGHTTRPNMLNEWRRYCGEHLHRFIHRLGDSPYADKIAGFYLAAMNSGEWWYYKGEGDPGWDYSPSRKKAFEQFVRYKYGPNNSDIAKAWGVPDDKHLLDLPTLEERGKFPVKPNSKVGDYMQVLNMPVTNAAAYFAKIIKAATSGRALAGMEIHMAGITYPINGTVLMNHLLDTPEIDFFGGPSNYGDRKPGATPLHRVAPASLAIHGKLWLNEGDYRTPLSYDTASGAQGEPPPDMEGMKQVFRREFARGAVFDYSTYLMDFGWAWFLDPSIAGQIDDVIKADAILADVGIERKAEIAVITDQESQFYGNYFASPTALMLQKTLDKFGASWDFYEMRDFLEGDRYKQYKLVIFLNTCALSDAERARIDAMKSDGRYLVWMHRPGTTDLSLQGARPEELISRLTGIRMRTGQPAGEFKIARGGLAGSRKVELPTSEVERRARLNIEVSLSDGGEGQLIGDHPSSYFCDDPSVKPLIVDAAGRPYVGIRKFDHWSSIYTAFCVIEPWLLRNLAREAGCHLWIDSDDVSYIADNLVALHATTAGRKRITLPEGKDTLYNLFTGEILKAEAGIVDINAAKAETFMFVVGNVDEDRISNVLGKLEAARERFLTEHPSKRMHVDFQRRYAPAPPAQSGAHPLVRWGHSSQPEVILAAGPFASDPETVEVVDQKLAALGAILHSRFRNISDRAGTLTADFLTIAKPLPLEAPDTGTRDWSAWATTFPWNSSHRIGFVNGQSYAGAVILSTSEEVPTAFVHLYTQGDARMWVDGREVKPNEKGHFHAPIAREPKKQLVIFRIRGSNEPTGFAIRFTQGGNVDPATGIITPQEAITAPLPAGFTQWVPEPHVESISETHQ